MTCKQNASYQITQGNKKTKHQKAEETREDQWRDFWMCETIIGTTPWQLHDGDDDDDDDDYDNDDDGAFYSENLATYEIMLKNIVQLDRPHTTTWCMPTACWIPKATNTQSECVILNAFPLQQWLRECASLLHYMHTAWFILW